MNKLLETEKKNSIIEDYLKNKFSIRELMKKYNLSNSYITDTLEKENVYIHTNDISKENIQKKGDLKKETNILKENSWQKYKKGNINKKEKDYNNKIAVCKKTGKKFKDTKNSSGALTEHIKKVYPHINIPSGFKRRKYKHINNKYWHEQFFHIKEKEKDNRSKLKCKYCNWETHDVINRTGSYTKHLEKYHKIDIQEHIKKYKEEEYLFKKHIKQKERKDILKKNNNGVKCKVCGKKLYQINNSHLKKHGLTVYEYKIKYEFNSITSKKTQEVLRNNIKNNQHKMITSFTSSFEKEVSNILKEDGIEHETKNKKLLNGLELDIVIHDKKIAIELNGNLYHSENYGGKNKQYHLNKTEKCNELGYYLIHIFEDEWKHKKSVVIQKLLHILKRKKKRTIGARKCKIKEISSLQKNNFLNKNHIQGEDKCQIKYGAFYNNELIGVMTFTNKRNMSEHKTYKNTWELSRYCICNDISCPGLASKMLKKFIKKNLPEKIISFADRRWTVNKENNLYTKLGFSFVRSIPPDYKYYNTKIDKYRRFHKFLFGKKFIKKKFPKIYSDKKTESMMMLEAGYDRIWDCGLFKYELKTKKNNEK